MVADRQRMKSIFEWRNMLETIEFNFGMWLVLLVFGGLVTWQLIQIEKILKQWLTKQDNLNISMQKVASNLETLNTTLNHK